jgi:hypothetical protein
MVFVTVFSLLALFSIITILVGSEDPGHSSEPRDNPLVWETLGRR